MAYWKKIKNTNAVPVLKDELVFDQTPTVNSTNPVTSDGVARAIAGASGEVPVVTESDNGKILTAIYDEGGAAVEWADAPQELPSTLGTAGQVLKVNAGGTGVEWGEAGANYTAGDGIDIDAQNAVSVKAGNGLEIGDVTSTGETVSLTTSAYYNVDDAWVAYDICPLTDSLLDSIASGLTLKLLHGTYVAFYPNATAYACLYSYASETSSSVTLDKRLVLGSAITLNQGFIFDNTEVTFDGGSVNAGLSNTTMSDLIADMSSHTYHVGILIKSNDNYLAAAHQVSDTVRRPSGPTTMATYTETTTIHDALNVSNPLPTSAVGDAGKVLTVNNAGAAEWAAAPSVTVDQTYNASSTNAQSGTAVAGALSTTRQVPPCYASDANKVLTVNSLGVAGWATPSGGGVTKQVISLTGATTSGDTTTTFTFNLASANQFYALGKQVSVSYKAPYFPIVDVSGAKIKLYYGTDTITIDATTYGNIFCASVFVGNEANISQASDPSLGYKFTKVEIVVPISGSDWASSTEAESLKIQILG